MLLSVPSAQPDFRKNIGFPVPSDYLLHLREELLPDFSAAPILPPFFLRKVLQTSDSGDSALSHHNPF